MPSSKVQPNTLVFCKDCNSTNSWDRYPVSDWLYDSDKIFEYAYKCRVCGVVTLRPREVYCGV